MQFAPVYPLLYRILRPSFPNCLWHGSENLPQVALTFDDGPHPQYTPQLLEVLDRYNVIASFFWLGSCVDRYPDIAKEVQTRGHWIGLHGYHHRSFPLMNSTEIYQSLLKTQTAIASACAIDGDRIRDVRPPNGLFTPKILKQLQKWNYHTVMWSVVPEDWVRPGIELVSNRVLRQVKNGALIVLHDGYHGGEDVAQTANKLIPKLTDQGYHFVNIDKMKMPTVQNYY